MVWLWSAWRALLIETTIEPDKKGFFGTLPLQRHREREGGTYTHRRSQADGALDRMIEVSQVAGAARQTCADKHKHNQPQTITTSTRALTRCRADTPAVLQNSIYSIYRCCKNIHEFENWYQRAYEPLRLGTS